MLRPLLVFWLIVYSIRYRTRPWNFFQLNSDYFNGKKKIFSKLELNENIPSRWRLEQVEDDGEIIPAFPVFIKPEWGQNSNGVSFACTLEELEGNRRERKSNSVTYLLQQAARERREFEIFYLREAESLDTAALLSVTETVNRSGETLVVNGINNRNTSYRDRTDLFNEDELDRIWAMVKGIGFFRIARVGVRADSTTELLAGNFHVIEVNIFLPMPLVLLDGERSWTENHSFIRQAMKGAAKLAGNSFQPTRRYPIFSHKLVAHYRVKERRVKQ